MLINSTHISKFLAPVVTRKTHEVRNTSCRVVKAGGQIYLVESGIKNSEKKGVFRIAARAEFRGNTFVPHGDFMKHFAKHRVTREEYDAVKKGWVDKGGCQLWELIIKEVYDAPLYLVPRQGEDRQTGLALLASVDCLAQGFQKKQTYHFSFSFPHFPHFSHQSQNPGQLISNKKHLTRDTPNSRRFGSTSNLLMSLKTLIAVVPGQQRERQRSM